MGSKLSQKNDSYQKSAGSVSGNEKKHNIKIKKKMKKYFKIKSPKKINTEDISVNVTPKKRKQKPNFMALTILWAHYKAYNMGLLSDTAYSPWEDYGSNKDWRNFLDSMIQDSSWTEWITNPEEVKARTKMAFETSKYSYI
ncbi:MAG: hypothetical protein ACOCQN_00345 [Halanaerobiaceae bacterium]